ncbi:ATP-binding cassette domain-containing protein [Candidatus Nanopusillus massiliensis]|uniref:ATP-binding cassette domain-containing protein n=1 Tax=Candidatus Nanopusillus massiliensis TaxID=2897163 RepID=UPI001E39CFE6|nr:ATP-binding cassette domain-containing protein [Candidatus Nanopusillus massiliensis]
MLKIEGLNVYSDNKKILENINLEFEYGKLYLIFGASGSGKTTLAKAILNDESLKKEGKIFLDNIDITNEKTENTSNIYFILFRILLK